MLKDIPLDDVIGFDQYESTICCCKEHLPHDESLKFKLIASKKSLKLAPFKSTPKGNLIEQVDYNIKCTIPSIYNELKIYYRNKQI